MSSIDTALFTRLSTFGGFVALAGTRVYSPPAPENATYPLVTYQQISGIRSHVYGPTQTGFVQARFQFDSWAETSVGVRALADQVRLALSTYHGTSDTIVIDLITIDNETRFYEEEADLHRISQDYFVSYREVVP